MAGKVGGLAGGLGWMDGSRRGHVEGPVQRGVRYVGRLGKLAVQTDLNGRGECGVGVGGIEPGHLGKVIGSGGRGRLRRGGTWVEVVQ